MEDVIFKEEEGEKILLGDVLKEDGRTQTWLNKKLSEYGINRDKAQISLWCRGVYKPKDDYVLRVISDILGKEYELIKSCFDGE